MKSFNFFKRFYSFYANLRFRRPQIIVFQWAAALIVFFQLTILALRLDFPDLTNSLNNKGAIYHFQCFFLMLPWFFGSNSFVYDSFFFLFLNVIALIILEIGVYFQRKRKYLHSFYWLFTRVYQSYFCPVIRFPFYFRFSYLIKLILRNSHAECWISCAICFINIAFTFYFSILSSIFLDPIDFIVESKIDIYDGKTNSVLIIFQYIFCVTCYLIHLNTDVIFITLIAVLIFIFCGILFYLRVLSTLHVSLFGAYIELAPLFCLPISIVVQNFFSKNWYYSFLSTVVVHLLFIIALKIEHYFMIRETWKIFNVFINKNESNENEEDIEAATYAPGNVVSGLRIMGMIHSDPKFFDKIIIAQHRSGIRISSMLEIVRFLSIFPSKRITALKELENMKSNSNYNQFKIYFFTKVLKSLTHNCNDKHKTSLYYFQRSYIVHNHLYWVSRSKGNKIECFKEAFSAIIFYLKLKKEISYLLSRFPFDSSIYETYSDFLLLCCGDNEGSKMFLHVANEISKNQLYVADPLVGKMTQFNPLILKYCSGEENKSSLFTGYYKHKKNILSDLGFGTEKDKNNQSVSNEKKEENENVKEKLIHISSYLKKSKYYNPFFSIIHYFIVSILLMYVLFSVLPYENKNIELTYNVINSQSMTIQKYEFLGASFFLPFGVIDYANKTQNSYFYWFNFSFYQPNMTELECMSSYDSIFYHIFSFFSNFPQMSGISQFTMRMASNYGRINLKNNQNACQMLQNLSNYLMETPLEIIDHFSQSLNETFINLTKIYNNVIFNYHIENSFVAASISLIVVLLLFLIITYFQVNTVMKRHYHAISYLSSRERLTCMLLEEIEKSWDALSLFLPDNAEWFKDIKKKLIEYKPFPNFCNYEYSEYESSSLEVFNNDVDNKDDNIRFELNQPSNIENDNNTFNSFSFSDESSVDINIADNDFNDGYIQVQNPKRDNKNSNFSVGRFSHDSPFSKTYLKKAPSSYVENIGHLIYKPPPSFHNGSSNADSSQPDSSNKLAPLRKPINSSMSSINSSKKQNSGENNFVNHVELINEDNLVDDFINHSSSNDIFEGDQIDYTVDQTKESTKYSWLETIFSVLFPWILLFLSLIFLLYPIASLIRAKKSIILLAFDNLNQLKNCFKLLEITFLYSFKQNISSSEFLNIHYAITSANSTITDLYYREQCYQLLGITCASSYELLMEIINQTASEERVVFVSLPFFVFFGKSILDDIFYNEIVHFSEIFSSSPIAFFIIVVFLVIAFIIYGFINNNSRDEGFNSLYHFPKAFLNNTNEFFDQGGNDFNKIQKRFIYNFPSIIICVLVFPEDNKIYSISENANIILNRPSSSFVGENFDDIFIEPTNNKFDLEHNFEISNLTVNPLSIKEYFMPDKSSKKTFLTSIIRKSSLNMFIMIEDHQLDQHSKRNYLEDSLTEKLMNFIPTYYAKSLLDDGIKSFEYSNPTIIYIRFDSDLSLAALEQFFGIINMAIMNYSSIKAIKADGSLLLFTTIKAANPIIPFLFARDLILETEFPKRGKPNKGIFSILIGTINHLTATLNDNGEPFLELNSIEIENSVFNLAKGEISISSDMEAIIPKITENGYPSNVNFLYRNVSFRFSEYLHHISHFL